MGEKEEGEWQIWKIFGKEKGRKEQETFASSSKALSLHLYFDALAN